MILDLNVIAVWTCLSNVSWSRAIESSNPNSIYTVRFEWHHATHNTQYDYTCTCMGYKYGGGTYCKHIKHVEEMQLRCAWNGELEPTARCSQDTSGRNICPECCGPVVAIETGI